MNEKELAEAREELTQIEMEHAELRVHTRESSPIHEEVRHPRQSSGPLEPAKFSPRKPRESEEDRYLASLGRRFENDLMAAKDDTTFAASLRRDFNDTVDPPTPTVSKKTRDRLDRTREEREIRLLRERETARLREPQARASAMRREEVCNPNS